MNSIEIQIDKTIRVIIPALIKLFPPQELYSESNLVCLVHVIITQNNVINEAIIRLSGKEKIVNALLSSELISSE
jgi:hypothetical protein